MTINQSTPFGVVPYDDAPSFRELDGDALDQVSGGFLGVIFSAAAIAGMVDGVCSNFGCELMLNGNTYIY